MRGGIGARVAGVMYFARGNWRPRCGRNVFCEGDRRPRCGRLCGDEDLLAFMKIASCSLARHWPVVLGGGMWGFVGGIWDGDL